MNTSISLCMIVMDEEEHLRECLESVRGVVDEIIVVDTGSRDNTVSIAQSFGAKVLYHEWGDDFSIPRNISLDHAGGDWILILDADEVLTEESKTKIRELKPEKEILGYLLLIQLHPEWTDMRSLRLFRNLSELRYRGVYHEKLAVPEQMYSRIVNSDIRIIHKPWCNENFKKKITRNIKLLTKHISLYPDDIYQILDLARLYIETEKLSESEKLLERVLLLLLRKRQGDTNYNLYHAHYYLYKLKLLSKRNIEFENMLSICEEALSALPSYPLFLYEAAKIYYKLKKYDKAIDYFKRCLAPGDKKDFERIIMFPKDILGAKSLKGLGYCFFKIRNYKESERYFEKSYMLKKDEKIKTMLHASRCLIKKHKKTKKSALSILL